MFHSKEGNFPLFNYASLRAQHCSFAISYGEMCRTRMAFLPEIVVEFRNSRHL